MMGLLMAAGILAFSVLTVVGLLALALRKAPEGYEDHYGFHAVEEVSRKPGLPAAAVSEIRRVREEDEVGDRVVWPA